MVCRLHRQSGAAAVEMALATLMLIVVLLVLVDVSRWLHAWNAASDATRLGARLASICERSADGQRAVRDQMRPWLPELAPARAAQVIRVEYQDSTGASSPTCGVDDCRQVSVWLDGYAISALGGLVPGGALPLPRLRATVIREGLQSRTGACRPAS